MKFEQAYFDTLLDDSRLECGICWWVYDPALGDEVGHIPSKTPFSQLPEHWCCPECGNIKSKFLLLQD